MWVLYLMHFLYGIVMYMSSIDVISIPHIYIGAIVWFAINQYNVKCGIQTRIKAFIIPIILIVGSIIITLLYEGIDTNFYGTKLFLWQFIIYVLCYIAKYVFLKIKKMQFLTSIFDKFNNIFSKCYWGVYVLHWLAGGAFIALCTFFIDVKYNGDIVLIIGYVEMLIGGFVWFFLNKYAEKHSRLSDKQLFILPIILMLTTATSGLFVKEEGDYFPWIGKFIMIFPQIIQFLEYILCYYIEKIIKHKRNFVKKYYWTLYLLHWLIAGFVLDIYPRDTINMIEMFLGGFIWYIINYYTLKYKNFDKRVLFLIPLMLMLTLMVSVPLISVPLLDILQEDVIFSYTTVLFQMIVYVIVSALGWLVKRCKTNCGQKGD